MNHGHQQCPAGYSPSPYHNINTLPTERTHVHPTGAPKDVCDDDGDDALRFVFHFMHSCSGARSSFSDHSVIIFISRCAQRSVTG